MATSNKTLFAQLKEGSDATDIPSSAWNSPSTRWMIVAVAVILTALALPRSSVDTQSEGYDRTMLGTIWSQEDVVAEYAFPVRKSPNALASDRRSAADAQPPVYTVMSGPQQPISVRLDQTTSRLPSEARSWIRQHWSTISSFYTKRPIVSKSIDSISSDVIILQADSDPDRLLDITSLADTSMVRSWVGDLVASAPQQQTVG